MKTMAKTSSHKHSVYGRLEFKNYSVQKFSIFFFVAESNFFSVSQGLGRSFGHYW